MATRSVNFLLMSSIVSVVVAVVVFATVLFEFIAVIFKAFLVSKFI